MVSLYIQLLKNSCLFTPSPSLVLPWPFWLSFSFPFNQLTSFNFVGSDRPSIVHQRVYHDWKYVLQGTYANGGGSPFAVGQWFPVGPCMKVDGTLLPVDKRYVYSSWLFYKLTLYPKAGVHCPKADATNWGGGVVVLQYEGLNKYKRQTPFVVGMSFVCLWFKETPKQLWFSLCFSFSRHQQRGTNSKRPHAPPPPLPKRSPPK